MGSPNLAAIAHETLAILDRGWYDTSARGRVDLSADLSKVESNTRLIRPDHWPGIEHDAERVPPTSGRTSIELSDETTLAAARRAAGDAADVLVLNFASATNPGGGFLRGAVAQEESLARSSALYASLRLAPDYYRANHACGDTFYTDHAILSRHVPVFRDDSGALLDRPFRVAVLTMPAVNKNGMTPDPAVGADVMERRIGRVFSLAVVEGFQALLLGAWGCGAFRNDPDVIAELFAKKLRAGLGRRALVARVRFAVYDNSADKRVFAAFSRWIGAEGRFGADSNG